MAKTNGSSIVVGAEGPSWEEQLGSKNWEGLLDPLNLSLRRFIIRCGDFCQCVSDAFNNDNESPYYGTCRYGEKSFFNKVKFEFASEYEISTLLYASVTDNTGIVKETNFIGYVAISNDSVSQLLGRREIYVVLRGTETPDEWSNNFSFDLVPVTPLLRADPDAPKVMRGWLNLYTTSNPSSEFAKSSLREQLNSEINQLRQDYKDENLSIVLIGHSLGGAMAVLSAFDLVENGASDIPVAAFIFAAPRVGDEGFKERLQRYPNFKILHTRNVLDIVPSLPPDLLGYRPVGVEVQIDGRKSTYLKEGVKIGEWHNLQGMMHVVSGWHGKEGLFQVVVKRSLALANKTAQLLKQEYKIPAAWSAVANKGMMRNQKKEWLLAPPLQED